jgi:quercetin dioxygenase-like cupin family protein
MTESMIGTAEEAEVYDLGGAEHRILLDGQRTGGVAAVIEVIVLPGAGSPPHSDEREDLVWYVTEGTLEFDTDHGRVSLGSGGSLFCARGSRHAFENTGTQPAKAVMVAVPAGVEEFFRAAASVVPAGLPAGPPPPEAVAALADVARRHGIALDTRS